MQIKNKKAAFIEVIIIIIFSSVVSLGFIVLLKLLVVRSTETTADYNIETDVRATAQVLTDKVKKSKRVNLIPDLKFLDNTKLQQNWSYIGKEESSIIGFDNTRHNDIVYYEYRAITKTHKRIVLAKAEKNVNYELEFVKKNLPDKENILKFIIAGYVDSQQNKPNQKTETAVEGLNNIEITNETLGDKPEQDLNGNFTANSIKFSAN